MKKFVNIYGEERTKKEYVEDKIDILDDFLIFEKRSVLESDAKQEDRRYWVRRILLAQETETQINSLCQMLTVKGMPIDIFIERYSKEYLGI